ncbi:fluoride efflux transporter CrcB [Parapedobacter tibetensis]|uniref:fluoride efflux transporter CrcB n=1 Tax=Parapedobacter tibetensis TaxID=2972951 RepID=UPI00214D7C4A|nr:fluoride efflux transporter CrcB [Parapedobacter tibetensis]
MIKQLVMVGIGGGVGSIFRFLVSVLTSKYFQGTFPLATFIVNLSGCFFIGLLVGFFSQPPIANTNLRLLLITGFCGGYTTFSAFASENLLLMQNNQSITSIVYTVTSVSLGIFFVWVGVWVTKMV